MSWKYTGGACNGFVIERKTGDGIWKTQKKIKKNTMGGTFSYTDKTAVGKTTYRYRIRAYRSVDISDAHADGPYYVDRPGDSSSHRTLVCGLPTPKVSVQSINKKANKVTWKQVPSAQAYFVYRANSKTGALKRIATVKNSLSYQDTTVKAGKTYYYTVRAYWTNTGKTRKLYSNYAARVKNN